MVMSDRPRDEIRADMRKLAKTIHDPRQSDDAVAKARVEMKKLYAELFKTHA
jgi:hypothetical protein